MSIGIGDIVVVCRPRREVCRACLCPKTCCAGVRRGGRRRVDRLRHIVDGIAVDESRCRSCRADVDLRRIVNIARRRIGIAVNTRLVARRNRQRTLLDRQRARGRSDVVVRRKASAAGRKCSTIKGHRIRPDTRTLRNGIAAVHCRNRVLRKAVA